MDIVTIIFVFSLLLVFLKIISVIFIPIIIINDKDHSDISGIDNYCDHDDCDNNYSDNHDNNNDYHDSK